MKKQSPKKLALSRETVSLMNDRALVEAGGQLGTLTYEGSCGASTCPCHTGKGG
jgi:hypothetical protein